MDDLIAIGTIALAFVCGAAIVLVVGIIALLYFCWQAIAAGNIFFVTRVAVALAVAVFCYGAIGIFLRKTNTL